MAATNKDSKGKSGKSNLTLSQKLAMSKKLLMKVVSFGFKIISVLYSLIWAIIFCVYVHKYKYEKSCNKLRNWDIALYAFLFASFLLTIASSIIQISSKGMDSSLTNFLMIARSLVNFGLNLVLLIAITVVFFKGKKYKQCKPLWKANYVYIIIQWLIIVLVFLFVIAIVVISLIRKRVKKSKIDEDDFSDDETKL